MGVRDGERGRGRRQGGRQAGQPRERERGAAGGPGPAGPLQQGASQSANHRDDDLGQKGRCLEREQSLALHTRQQGFDAGQRSDLDFLCASSFQVDFEM